MKKGDLVKVSGFTSVLDVADQIGLILEVFVKDNAAWVLFPSSGKVYINLNSLKKISEEKNEKQSKQRHTGSKI